jgi:hypothetical protein
MVRDTQTSSEPGRRLLLRHGVTVIEGSPVDSLDRLIGHGRGRIRRAG